MQPMYVSENEIILREKTERNTPMAWYDDVDWCTLWMYMYQEDRHLNVIPKYFVPKLLQAEVASC